MQPPSDSEPRSTRPTNVSGRDRDGAGGLPRSRRVTRLDRVTGIPAEPASGDVPAPRPRLARARAAFSRGLRTLLAPDGLPKGASVELESALGDIGREALDPGARAPAQGAGRGGRRPTPDARLDVHPGDRPPCRRLRRGRGGGTVLPPDQVDPDGGRCTAARAGRRRIGVHPRGWAGPGPGHRRCRGPGGGGGPRRVRLVQHGVLCRASARSRGPGRRRRRDPAVDQCRADVQGEGRRPAHVGPLHGVPAHPAVVGERPRGCAALRVVPR